MPTYVFCLGMDEYCLNDKFKGECNTNEVILVTTARFGRMEIGKCVTSDQGKLFTMDNAMILPLVIPNIFLYVVLDVWIVLWKLIIAQWFFFIFIR